MQLFDLPIPLELAALNLCLAMFCGALIGSERQVRQRMAGLRTNALVATGAASYVVFASLFPDEVSPTRVAAQVVSGIGFLGAGIIFRHGFTVHGLNTAATLWCSAAVGLIAGAGAVLMALLVTGLIVFVNLGLRPFVKWLKRKTKAGVPLTMDYRIVVTCKHGSQSGVRASALEALANHGLRITGFERHDQEVDNEMRCRLEITVAMEDQTEMALNRIIAPLIMDPNVESVDWDLETDA